ncbi:MAG: division/cell wall cluster transcriptional repressor MraZ [Algoriphagus sp.]|uniref:division/cell wall cluster transcriptional repressor MraZ n=1 Tax=Algoriphagus sp. TaxID=1872435 RepID=UPI00271BD3EC|nr:division/cell wall cluster transcriptional repressor MraZ [Algoriphagus sp.]MDO8967133.1 division/cell wall cluster transcriptional repressor MraZ [Algoriphagus sp.]MDP2041774.1 division/cell wall cluster transcriptional repressor MraZ [Algoriphagus sp.]MDP3200895.1 division/cell wall cluster transcriptional repressor MraZ [Algoriphagus sp.]MDP3473487.1 division/cell wall cluster transcriptional repressor MraZ [Algoriphagus sp.]
MFNCRYDCKLDPKGRLVLPSKIKGAIPEANGSALMLQMAADKCLKLYPMVEFRKLESQVNALSDHNEETRRLKRSFFTRITEVELDSAGRFLIPKAFQEYAGLDKDVILVGVGSKIEMWSADRYKDFVIEDDIEMSQQMEKYLS